MCELVEYVTGVVQLEQWLGFTHIVNAHLSDFQHLHGCVYYMHALSIMFVLNSVILVLILSLKACNNLLLLLLLLFTNLYIG